MKDFGTVFVTGAGGGIGGRLVERLYLSRRAIVRAGVHHWSNASRVARFPVDIVECDVLDEEKVLRSLNGIDAVVHCAYGGKRVNEEGTMNVLKASMAVGVGRFVHISTVEVHGAASGEMDESASLQYSGSEYGDSKLNAEKICVDFQAEGLPVVVLRPTVVYGPFIKVWTISVAERLGSCKWKIPETARGFCQPVYVDDVVSAILLALGKKRCVGEVFNIAGQGTVTWDKFFEQFNDVLGLPPLKRQGPLSARLKAVFMSPVRSMARYAISKHSKLTIKMIRKLHLESFAKRAEISIKTSPTIGELNLYKRTATYRIDKARSILGYSPSFDLDRGLRLTALWLKHNGYIA